MTNHNVQKNIVSVLALYKFAFLIKDSFEKVIYESLNFKELEEKFEVKEENVYYDKENDKYYEYHVKKLVIGKEEYNIFSFTDITKFQKEIADGLQDKITTLPNRNMIESKCKQREEKSTIFVLCDLDNFKVINDNFGHPVGDYVLNKVGKIFKNNVLENNFVGRYGGEEFLMMFYTTDLNEVKKILEKLRLEIESDILLEDNYKVYFSSGVAIYDGSNTIDEIIKQADKALYYVKNHGKNKSAIYDFEKKEYVLF